MKDDTIKRSDAIKVVRHISMELVDADTRQKLIEALPSADRPQGEWKEKTTFHNADDNPIIEEWQSARCSVCGKYHTTPYLYYFNDYNYCPNCGAKMFAKDTNVSNKKGAGDE